MAEHGSLIGSWAVMAALAASFTLVLSGSVFLALYWRPSFATWRHKTNPVYPPATMVRREVLQALKGSVTATFFPALSLFLTGWGVGQAYCGLGEWGWTWLVASFAIVVVGSDLFEWAWHRIGHLNRRAWREHKHHHVFFNPSPFSVVADEQLDQLVRSAPLLFFPLLMPVNMDLLFFTFAAFFYGYGVVLHSGHEVPGLSAHQPVINTAFQHYVHHARSSLGTPYHTGFFVKLWDQLAGSTWPDEGTERCLCAPCCRARGERTEAAFEALDKPDYSVLLQPRFWWTGKAEQPAVGRA